MTAAQAIAKMADQNPAYLITEWTSNFAGHPGSFTGTLNPNADIPDALLHDPLRSQALADAMCARYGEGAGFPPRTAGDVNGPAVPTARYANGGWRQGEGWQEPSPATAAMIGLTLPLSELDKMDLRACNAFSEQVKKWNGSAAGSAALRQPGKTATPASGSTPVTHSQASPVGENIAAAKAELQDLMTYVTAHGGAPMRHVQNVIESALRKL